MIKILGCKEEEIYYRVEELFEKWKKARKARKKKQEFKKEDTILVSKKKFTGEIVLKSSEILRTQPEHIVKTVRRFMDDLQS